MILKVFLFSTHFACIYIYICIFIRDFHLYMLWVYMFLLHKKNSKPHFGHKRFDVTCDKPVVFECTWSRGDRIISVKFFFVRVIGLCHGYASEYTP